MDFPPLVYDVLIAATAIVVVAAGTTLWRTRRTTDWAVAVFFAGLTVTLLAGLHWTEFQLISRGGGTLNQGRYLLPLVGIAGLCVAQALRLLPPRLRPYGVGVVTGGLLALQLLALGLMTGSVLCVARAAIVVAIAAAVVVALAAVAADQRARAGVHARRRPLDAPSRLAPGQAVCQAPISVPPDAAFDAVTVGAHHPSATRRASSTLTVRAADAAATRPGAGAVLARGALVSGVAGGRPAAHGARRARGRGPDRSPCA